MRSLVKLVWMFTFGWIFGFVGAVVRYNTTKQPYAERGLREAGRGND